MGDYEEWCNNQEEEESQLPPVTFDPEVHLKAKRKSIVIHDRSKSKGREDPNEKERGKEKEGEEGQEEADPAQSSTVRLRDPSGARAAGAGNRSSKIFPDVELTVQEPKKQQQRQEPTGEKIYRTEAKWPWVLVALVFLAGSVAMAVFGGICIRRDFEDPANAAAACGPGGGGGGIVMLIGGALIFPLSIWQLWRLKDQRREFVGYKQTP